VSKTKPLAAAAVVLLVPQLWSLRHTSFYVHHTSGLNAVCNTVSVFLPVVALILAVIAIGAGAASRVVFYAAAGCCAVSDALALFLNVHLHRSGAHAALTTFGLRSAPAFPFRFGQTQPVPVNLTMTAAIATLLVAARLSPARRRITTEPAYAQAAASDPSPTGAVHTNYPPAGTGTRISFQTAVRSCLSKYVVWSGRASRAEYWWWTLAYMLAFFGGGTIAIAAHAPVLVGLIFLGAFLPTISVTVRRLHDIGRSGAWYWIALIPLVGDVALLVFVLQSGDRLPNAYGPPA
jgi:uncharacterized membrane protein YhaH (DUF805 family)